jgi:hypothetical protein
MQYRQYESGCLTGAGLGQSDKVVALHDFRDGLGLNGGWGVIPCGGDACRDVGVKTKCIKVQMMVP